MKKTTLLLALFFFLVPPALFSQTTIFVNSSTGDDASGDGTSGAPYKTFYKGYTVASSGDILDLAGTFTWTDADETGDAATTGFTIAKNITIRGNCAGAIVQAATSGGTADRRVFTISAGYSVTISGLTIRYGNVNTGVNYDGGGGIKNSGTLYLDGCLVTGNKVITQTYQFGGGFLDADNGTATITNCDFSYNSSSGWGGAIYYGNYASPGPLTMLNTVVHDNSAAGRGGGFAVMLTSGVNKITNCTFFNNSSGGYGAVWNDRANGVYTNCTITGNPNGGMSHYGSTVYLKNNLFADNTSYDFSYVGSGSISDDGYNLVETSNNYTFSGTGDITGNQANLNISSSLADNSTLNGTYSIALQSGSVAIDAGNAAAHGPSGNTVTPLSYDQRGYSRNGVVDMGAYEVSTMPDYCWMGQSGSDWNTSCNWRSKTIPSGTFNMHFDPLSYSDLQLDQDRTIDSIDFTSSSHKLILGAYSVTASKITNAGTNSYIQTDGSGKLTSTISNLGTFTFPVGNSSYDPVSITNNTGSDDGFSARVLDEVYANGTDGTVTAAAHIKRTWDIEKDNPNSGSVNFVFHWNSGEESAAITTKALFHYNGGWNVQTGTTSSTTTSLTYTGYTGTFSPFAVAESAALLPVTWISFTAQQQNDAVLLKWSTAIEQNVDGYLVQHSPDGVHWETIGTKAGAGNSNVENDYSFIHSNPVAGINYYRLVQKDLDGKENFSKVISINFDGIKEQLSVYPNPVTDGRINVKLQKASMIRIFNSLGMLVLQKEMPEGVYQVNVAQLTKGIYSIKAGNETALFVIQ